MPPNGGSHCEKPREPASTSHQDAGTENQAADDRA
jgi:hypothetical protein